MTQNPYSPPAVTDPSPDATRESSTEFRHGPVWYIVLGGLAGAFVATPFILMQQAVGLSMGLFVVMVMVLVGCIVGGLLFRVRSQHWPVDPTVRILQAIYSLLAVFLPPLVLFLLAAANGSSPAGLMVGVAIGAAVACGIFASGTRRFRGRGNTGDR